MPKANFTLPDGTTVTIDGTAEEVAALLARFSGPPPGGRRPRKGPTKTKLTAAGARGKTARKGPQVLIQDLASANWFKNKRTIGDVKKKLEEDGHIYPLYSLSTPLLRLTRSKVLRRIRDKQGWVYVS